MTVPIGLAECYRRVPNELVAWLSFVLCLGLGILRLGQTHPDREASQSATGASGQPGPSGVPAESFLFVLGGSRGVRAAYKSKADDSPTISF